MDALRFSVTATAMDKIQEFLEDRQPTPVGVRVFVYQDNGAIAHSMTFAESIEPTDRVFNIGGITFLTDPNSAIFLNNMILDFVTVGDSSGFVFQNACSGKSCLTCRGACQKTAFAS